jgi:hypothetical protein
MLKGDMEVLTDYEHKKMIWEEGVTKRGLRTQTIVF